MTESQAADVGPLKLWMASAETNLVSNVSRGENARRRVRETAVVRQLDLAEVLSPVSRSAARLYRAGCHQTGTGDNFESWYSCSTWSIDMWLVQGRCFWSRRRFLNSLKKMRGTGQVR